MWTLVVLVKYLTTNTVYTVKKKKKSYHTPNPHGHTHQTTLIRNKQHGWKPFRVKSTCRQKNKRDSQLPRHSRQNSYTFLRIKCKHCETCRKPPFQHCYLPASKIPVGQPDGQPDLARQRKFTRTIYLHFKDITAKNDGSFTQNHPQ